MEIYSPLVGSKGDATIEVSKRYCEKNTGTRYLNSGFFRFWRWKLVLETAERYLKSKTGG